MDGTVTLEVRNRIRIKDSVKGGVFGELDGIRGVPVYATKWRIQSMISGKWTDII